MKFSLWLEGEEDIGVKFPQSIKRDIVNFLHQMGLTNYPNLATPIKLIEDKLAEYNIIITNQDDLLFTDWQGKKIFELEKDGHPLNKVLIFNYYQDPKWHPKQWEVVVNIGDIR